MSSSSCAHANTVNVVDGDNVANPGGRWIVDGMNVIGCRPDGWWRDRRSAMVALVTKLERWAEAAGDVTVVFEQPPVPPINSNVITVAYASSAYANSGDDEIVRLLEADDQPQDIRVATSDTALAERVRAAGGSVYPAAGFRNLIDPPKSTPERPRTPGSDGS